MAKLSKRHKAKLKRLAHRAAREAEHQAPARQNGRPVNWTPARQAMADLERDAAAHMRGL